MSIDGYYNINYIYMFKNPVRFFVDIKDFENIISNPGKVDIKELDWTKPFSFNIRKHYGKSDLRSIEFPNMVNFFVLFSLLSKEFDFPKFPNMKNSRMIVNLTTGDFPASQYKTCLENDKMDLVEYDTLYKMDIKSFYDTIYTHNLKSTLKFSFNDSFISNQNDGKTGGIIKGPYTSLFLAELYLGKIISDYNEQMVKNNVKCKVEFFSDDIYVFINKEDETKAKHLLSETLKNYGLQINTDKYDKYDYQSYSKENIIDKYWNIVVRDQKKYEDITDDKKYYLNFLNQLIYRKDKLNDKKLESIFVTGFFKSQYFIDFKPEKYTLTRSDLHKILFIYREHPESILYSVHKFAKLLDFKVLSLYYLREMFLKSLSNPYNEEQMYYFYALDYLYDEKFINDKVVDGILNSDNQLLMSYFILSEYSTKLKFNFNDLLLDNESQWFLNYHLILRKYLIKKIDSKELEELVTTYLIPKSIKKKTNEIYIDFYATAIKNGFKLINFKVTSTINEYLKFKKSSYE